jgi:lipid-A-disaccharide synthase
MRIFFSVGEPSGDQHAAHLIEELRRRDASIEVRGFGGPLMEQAGCRLLFRMSDLAVMGIFRILPMLLTFWRLYKQAKRDLTLNRPDAVVLIDFPGFNWHVARAAKRLGIPVFYYMPPQLWAWAPWRIKKVRKYVDHILSGLTFERDWYAARGVDVAYVGHPFFDEVADHPLDHGFVNSRRRDGHAKPIRNVAILPGSRHHEVTRNGPALVQVMKQLAARHPDIVFRVACYRELHRTLLTEMCVAAGGKLPVEFCVAKTPEIVELADCCLMVSGSVSLELLARRTPAVVIYKGGPLAATLAKWVLTCKFITLPNLLADRQVMPEFFYSGDDEPTVAAITRELDAWLSDPAKLGAKRNELEQLASLTATTGATARAADALLARLSVRNARRLAA